MVSLGCPSPDSEVFSVIWPVDIVYDAKKEDGVANYILDDVR